MREVKLLTHRFPSGNSIDVYVRPLGDNLFDCRIEWDRFPPSKRDIARYKRDVAPRFSLEWARLYGESAVAPNTLYLDV